MKHTFALRPLICVTTLALLASACDGCSDKPKPETKPDMPKEVEAPDVAPDLPPEDPLKEAREAAEKEAPLLAVTIGDTARLVASQIEAAQKTPTKSTKTRIKTSEPAEKGSIDPSAANKIFRRFDGAMKKCYERALKKRPGLEGKVKLLVIVKEDGTVKRAKASGISLKDSSVNNCMEALTPRMKFPKPKGGAARISKTYAFSPAL